MALLRGRQAGYKMDEGTKAKIRRAAMNRVVTEETREKIRAALKGRDNSELKLKNKIRATELNLAILKNHEQINTKFREVTGIPKCLDLKPKELCQRYVPIPNTNLLFHVTRIKDKGWFLTMRTPVPFEHANEAREAYGLVWSAYKGLGDFYEDISKAQIENLITESGFPFGEHELGFISAHIQNLIDNNKFKKPTHIPIHPINAIRKSIYSLV